MQCAVVHLKTKGRMPVRLYAPIFSCDVQQEIPAFWCVSCGREVYQPGMELCPRCERMECDESNENKPLPELHPGQKPR